MKIKITDSFLCLALFAAGFLLKDAKADFKPVNINPSFVQMQNSCSNVLPADPFKAPPLITGGNMKPKFTGFWMTKKALVKSLPLCMQSLIP